MAKILVVGYGNPLRADDGLGCHVARQVAHDFRGDERVEVVPCHQLAPEIAKEIAESEFAIFIDATTEGEPGTITETSVLPDTSFAGTFTESMSPETLLASAKALYGACPAAVVFKMTGWCFDFGEQMSVVVSERLQSLVRMIEKNIEEHEAVLT
jgi:hydrogenase maturation protease